MSFWTFMSDPHIFIRIKISHALAVFSILFLWATFLYSLWRAFIFTSCLFFIFSLFLYRKWHRNFKHRPLHLEQRYSPLLSRTLISHEEDSDDCSGARSHSPTCDRNTLRGSIRDAGDLRLDSIRSMSFNFRSDSERSDLAGLLPSMTSQDLLSEEFCKKEYCSEK